MESFFGEEKHHSNVLLQNGQMLLFDKKSKMHQSCLGTVSMYTADFVHIMSIHVYFLPEG